MERDKHRTKKIISTHALTWSATYSKRWAYIPRRHFNSRAHVERDLSVLSSVAGLPDFNSRAHVERDQI